MKGEKDRERLVLEEGEAYERFYSPRLRRRVMEYSYRMPDGSLFVCTSSSVEGGRKKRDRWMERFGQLLEVVQQEEG